MKLVEANSTLFPAAFEYVIARRHYAAAVRRGDLKTAQAWLDIAEREIALTERYERTEFRRDRHRAWEKEQPHRLAAMKARASYPR